MIIMHIVKSMPSLLVNLDIYAVINVRVKSGI